MSLMSFFLKKGPRDRPMPSIFKAYTNAFRFPMVVFYKYHCIATVHYNLYHVFDSCVKFYLDFFLKHLNSLPRCLHGFREQAGEICG